VRTLASARLKAYYDAGGLEEQPQYSGLLLGLRSLLRLGAGKPATARGGGERAWSGGGSGSSSSPPCSVVLVQGDSNLIIQQVKGENAVKKDHLQELHRQALGLQRQLEDRGASRD
jgi:hypothetical protein